MKTCCIILALAAALTIPATAGENGKKLKRTELFKRLDKNNNAQIDGAEIPALRAAFAKAGSTSPIRKIDLNKNGRLEEQEIEAFSLKYSTKLATQ